MSATSLRMIISGGTVIETQDKGMNSVITVDFGNGEVKRLLLRMAPIEML